VEGAARIVHKAADAILLGLAAVVAMVVPAGVQAVLMRRSPAMPARAGGRGPVPARRAAAATAAAAAAAAAATAATAAAAAAAAARLAAVGLKGVELPQPAGRRLEGLQVKAARVQHLGRSHAAVGGGDDLRAPAGRGARCAARAFRRRAG
jgi:hypothetical protein